MKTSERDNGEFAENVLELDGPPETPPNRLCASARESIDVERRTTFAEPTLQTLFNELAYGLIVIDAARQVSHINRAARGILAREQRLRVRGRTLDAWHERDANTFDVAIKKAFQGKRNIMRIGEAHGSIMLVPLSLAATPEASSTQISTPSPTCMPSRMKLRAW